MKQLLKGVKYLHSLGIMHRDLKLENVMVQVNEEGKTCLKIADFGLSTILECGKRINEQVGTPYYNSPELLRNEPYTFEVDVWSLGIICFILQTGMMPFNPNDDDELRRGVLEAKFGMPTEMIGSKEEKLIKMMLTKKVADRAKVEECLEVLLESVSCSRAEV